MLNINFAIIIVIILIIYLYIDNNKNNKKDNQGMIEGFSPETCLFDSKRTCTEKAKCEATEKDIGAALAYTNKTMCENRGYVFEQFPDGTFDCSHTKQTCLRDSEDADKPYLEWNTKINKCIYGMEEFKKYCNGIDKLRYDKNIGTCHVTENSCKSWGADWTANDCELNDGQAFGEAVVGTTMVRSIKNGFKCG
jgi:hypothetical protein